LHERKGTGREDQPRASPGRTGLAVAHQWIDRQIEPLAAESASPIDAVGRVLAEPVVAPSDLPPVDQATADGAAVRAEDTVGASTYNPVGLRLLPFGEAVLPFCATFVNIGQPLPRGADAIVPLDHVSAKGADGCEVIDTVAAGDHVARKGSQIESGSSLLPAGRWLGPHDAGLLLMAGIARVPARRRSRVRVVLTGPRVESTGAGTAQDADGPMLKRLIERDCGTVVEQRHVERDRAALTVALSAPRSDIVLIVGGTGRGLGDCASAALADAGELAIEGVAINPGETAGMGRTGVGTPVILLPGVPSACFWAYELLAGRAIRRLAGASPALPYASKEMRTHRKIVSRIGLTEVCPVRCIDVDGVEPVPSFAAVGIIAMAQADGFVILPEGSEGVSEGSTVTVHLMGICGTHRPHTSEVAS
jgi:molybdopterin molybdotransferase